MADIKVFFSQAVVCISNLGKIQSYPSKFHYNFSHDHSCGGGFDFINE